nr:hypothetical protein [Tanacetum cinerariifolium]
MQQPMINLEDIFDPTTTMNMALVLIAKSFKLNHSTPTNNNQRISSNPRNRQTAQPDMNMGQDRQMNVVEARAEGNVNGNKGNHVRCYNYKGIEFDLMAAVWDLDEIEEVNADCILMANLQQASTSGTQTDKTPVYDSDGSAENHTKQQNDSNVIAKVSSVEVEEQ